MGEGIKFIQELNERLLIPINENPTRHIEDKFWDGYLFALCDVHRAITRNDVTQIKTKLED